MAKVGAESKESVSQFEPIPLDGGYGWVVVLGSFLIHIFADGFLFSFGVISESLIDEFHASNASVAFILSLLIGLMLGTGCVASVSCQKLGCRITTIIGALISFSGCLSTYFANSLTFVTLSVGVVMGIGVGFMYCASIMIVTLYFEKRRSLATGITVCGAGLGTFIFPKAIGLLIDVFDWRTVFLIYSAILLLCVPCGLLFRPIKLRRVQQPTGAKLSTAIEKETDPTFPEWRRRGSGPCRRVFGDKIQPRIPVLESSHIVEEEEVVESPTTCTSTCPTVGNANENKSVAKEPAVEAENPTANSAADDDETQKSSEPPSSATVWSILNKVVDFSLLSDGCFWLFNISIFLGMAGYDPPTMFMPLNAKVVLGLDQSETANTVSIYGLASVFGRIGFGVLCDLRLPKFFGFGRDCAQNRLVIYAVTMALCGLASCAVFLLHTIEWFLAYCAFLGFMISSFMCLWSVILMDLVGFSRLTNAFAMLLFVQSVATFVGTPISGKLYDMTGRYDWTFAFCGVVQLVSGLTMFAILPVQALKRKKELSRNPTSMGTSVSSDHRGIFLQVG